MLGLLIIVGLGLCVLGALLYATRCDDNYDVAEGVEPHPGYRFLPSRNSGTRLPSTTLSPMDTVFSSELDADRTLRRAMHGPTHPHPPDDAG